MLALNGKVNWSPHLILMSRNDNPNSFAAAGLSSPTAPVEMSMRLLKSDGNGG